MNTQRTSIERAYYENFPLIDGEFDDFEWNDDLEALLHETKNATLYHASLHLPE